ncbi:LysR family transcriptional regulator [Burkholderia sp. THE68]|uniref:LysR family transcriptional regulator n=1 Tax=Burkholderia sp. THE68 TaxID=758782 RepID=UPI001389B5FF|nr:LysR family transcriptional regulator [Burkholderia sp. THE68]
MDRWFEMLAFIKVAELKSFAGAGRSLQLSTSAISRAVSSLEQRTGAALVTRTTRATTLTEAGQRYYEACVKIAQDMNEADATASNFHQAPNGTLAVSAPALFGKMYLLPVVFDYLEAYPSVNVHTEFEDRVSHMIKEELDVVLRIGHLPDMNFKAIRLGYVRRVICASPAYLEEHGIPVEPLDLQRHAMVLSSRARSTSEWRLDGGVKATIPLNPRLICNHNETAISAAVSGLGLIKVLSYQVRDQIASGQLQIVMEKFTDNPIPVQVLHVGGSRPSAKVRTFVDFTVNALKRSRAFDQVD